MREHELLTENNLLEAVMLRLIGGLLLVVCGGIVSVSIYRFQRKKLFVLDAFISLLLFIKGQIDCFSLPLCDILSRSPDALSELGAGESFSHIVEQNKIYLDRECYRLLCSFESEFGGLYKEEQLRRCDYYVSLLTEQRRVIFEDWQSRARVAGALCICSVIGILIILW